MVRGPCSCCGDAYLNKGPWMSEEDELLLAYITRHGAPNNWRKLPKAAGLVRCGKSCRLRWLNYLRPDLKRGSFSEDEADLIIRLHSLLGNRWALIAGRVPGRSDNEIKNYWNFHLSKKLLSMGINPKTHKPLKSSSYLGIDDSGSSFNSSSAEESPSPELVWLERDYGLSPNESTEMSNGSSADEQRQVFCSGNVTSSSSSQRSESGASSNSTSAPANWIQSEEWDSFHEMIEHNHSLVFPTMHQLEADPFTEQQGHGGLLDFDFLQDPSLELGGLLEIIEGCS